jgi:hypothetical protein
MLTVDQWNGNVEPSDRTKGNKVVNFSTDHSSDKKFRKTKNTRRSEPRSPEVNEGHQIWEMHGDFWMRIGGSNGGQLWC